MPRCAASFVIAAYVKVRLNPHALRALPLTFLQSLLFNILSIDQYLYSSLRLFCWRLVASSSIFRKRTLSGVTSTSSS